MLPTLSSDLQLHINGTRLAAFLVTALVSWGVPADSAPILLSCHGEPKMDSTVIASLCDALEAELNERKPDRVIRRSAAPDTLPRRVWDVALEVTRTENYHWEGYLTWVKTGRRKAGERTTGPAVEIFGMDAPLGPGAYSHFIRSLLKVSKPGFLASPRDMNRPFQGVSESSNN